MTAVLDRRPTADVPAAVATPPATLRTATAPYGFAAPTLDATRTALVDIMGAGRATDALWSELLSAARMPSGTPDVSALGRLAAAMTASKDPVVSLCGSSLQIRVRTFEQLSALRDIVDEVPTRG